MYYDNKSSFYIRQYGPAILVLLLSFALIGSGIYIYISSNKNTPNKEVILASDNLKDEQQIENVENNTNNEVEVEVKDEPQKDNSIIPADYENLKLLEKTDSVKVQAILDNGNIKVITSNSKEINVTLIGINFSNTIPDIISKMKSDLEGKNIKLAFDNVKVDNLTVFAYIYINDKLYNETILENGYAALKEEKTNTSLYNNLKQSQAYAKQTLAGIWNQ